MQHKQGSLNDQYQAPYSKLPMNHQDFRIMKSEGISYYMVDLKKIDMKMITDIVDGCAVVENECWKAQENFYDYIQKCGMLSYAVKKTGLSVLCRQSFFP